MPQVSRTTNDLIINSLYLVGELGVGEEADAFMLSTGLELINELLDKFSADSIYIPYLTTIDFNFVVGQHTYSISDIIAGTNIVSDRVVDLSFANYVIPGSGPVGVNPTTFIYTVDTINNVLNLGSTAAFPTGTPITLSTTGVVPSPLFAGEVYYVINVSPTSIALAQSTADALVGNPITLLSAGIPVNYISTNSAIQFTSQPIVYPLMIINKAEYYNVVRLHNLLARPGFIFLNKQPTESFITVYPVPDQPYPAQIQVKSMINELAADTDLTELPPYYYGFLKYALGRKWIAYYPSGNWPQQNEDEYLDYYNNLKNANETDLTIRPSVILDAPQPFYWPNILAY